ncbi:MAG TPA: zinc ribbon domain-containing protein, partial [Anaerolineales bacterium]
IVIALWVYWRSTQKSDSSIRSGARRRRSQRMQEAKNGHYCHECGARAQPGDRFCRTCGSRLRVE